MAIKIYKDVEFEVVQYGFMSKLCHFKTYKYNLIYFK